MKGSRDDAEKKRYTEVLTIQQACVFNLTDDIKFLKKNKLNQKQIFYWFWSFVCFYD